VSTAMTTPRPARATEARSEVVRPTAALYWTSIGLASVAAAAAAFTAFVPGVLRGTEVMNGSARGTALAVLFVAVPTFVVGIFRVSRGAVRPAISSLGATAFIVYNSVLFLFATPFNSLFLIYAATFALAFWTLVLLLRAIDVESLASRIATRVPAPGIAVYLAVIAVLNAAAWLGVVIPALFQRSPSFLAGTGLTTNPIYTQDMSFWIPLVGVSAVLLWRRKAWGYVLGGGALVYFVIESISIAVDQWMGGTADPTSSVASTTLAPVFLIVAAVGMIPLVIYFRRMSSA
jgi:hypothetical protein